MNNLTSIIENAFPALSGSGITYSKANNMFLADGYTSASGNTYFQGIRLSDRIIISYLLGQGYAYTFLNGIRIYGFDGRDKKLVASRDFSCNVFSEQGAQACCVMMIEQYLKNSAMMMNCQSDESELHGLATLLVQSAVRNGKALPQ